MSGGWEEVDGEEENRTETRSSSVCSRLFYSSIWASKEEACSFLYLSVPVSVHEEVPGFRAELVALWDTNYFFFYSDLKRKGIFSSRLPTATHDMEPPHLTVMLLSGSLLQIPWFFLKFQVEVLFLRWKAPWIQHSDLDKWHINHPISKVMAEKSQSGNPEKVPGITHQSGVEIEFVFLLVFSHTLTKSWTPLVSCVQKATHSEKSLMWMLTW